jgi:truncated hemoglobin YjbI
MTRLTTRVWALVAVGLLVGCGDPAKRTGGNDTGVPSVDTAAPAPDGGGGSPDAPPADGPPVAVSLYQRLGAEKGIRTVMTDFVTRVLGDAKINGFFLNAGVDGGKLINCLVLQVGSLTGGPQTYPSMGCRDMKASHLGMKVSMQDFNDLAGHLVASLTAAGVAKSDVDAVAGAVTPMASDIVEDKMNNGTVYQRVGRKPAIATVIDASIARIVADTRINGFFSATDAKRLKTCLVRQVCGIDGPCVYGKEVTHPSEPGVATDNPCKDMKTVHTGLTSPPGMAGGKAITRADFDALVGDIAMELDKAGVGAPEKMAILAALAPTCGAIVQGGLGCPGNTITAITSANTLITFDTKAPAAATAPVILTGLAAGEKVVGLTIRPANGKLYGLGTSNRLYEIDRASGKATAVGMMPFTPSLDGNIYGFDFNPTVDRIRAVSDSQQNLRFHPDMGTVAGVDTNLTPPGAISAIAYTNSYLGATTTTLYGIDVTSNKLVRVGGVDGNPSPNTGALTDVGLLGVDAVGAGGFDILWADGKNVAYVAIQRAGTSNSELYTADLATGKLTIVGAIGGVLPVRAIAVSP